MKYINPEMKISKFEVECIVTQSGVTVDGAAKAEAYLNENGYTADKVDISTLQFTY